MPPKPKKVRLYSESDGIPCQDFNSKIISWLTSAERVVGRAVPKAFGDLHAHYDLVHMRNMLKCPLPNTPLAQVLSGPKSRAWQVHRMMLSDLTTLMTGMSFANPAVEKTLINAGGIRTLSSQSAHKNTGENFTNAIVYALANALRYQDDVLVDKRMPPELRKSLTLKRPFECQKGVLRDLTILIEVDLCIFSRKNPLNAILVSAKTRMKEVWHIVTMWKLFFDMIGDECCYTKWGLTGPAESLDEMLYVGATADMISTKGTNTQGADVERDKEVRNLIGVDASFLDYTFVSKANIPHVADTLEYPGEREALFHELGCLLDLVAQKFGIQ